jgi:hypothetical protein
VDTETTFALEADDGAVAEYLAEHGGLLVREVGSPGRYWLVMRPQSAPGERFYVLVAWSVYPHAAPSVKFADGVGGSFAVAKAWPVIPGYRAGSDICKPFTAEGFALHSDWQRGPEAWKATGNPFLWVAEVLQEDLNQKYGGRVA